MKTRLYCAQSIKAYAVPWCRPKSHHTTEAKSPQLTLNRRIGDGAGADESTAHKLNLVGAQK